jgi:hypothetical protein
MEQYLKWGERFLMYRIFTATLALCMSISFFAHDFSFLWTGCYALLYILLILVIRNTIIKYLIHVILGALLLLPGLIQSFLWLVPPNSNGHPVMPISQVFISIILVLLLVILALATIKTSKEKFKKCFLTHIIPLGIGLLSAFILNILGKR